MVYSSIYGVGLYRIIRFFLFGDPQDFGNERNAPVLQTVLLYEGWNEIQRQTPTREPYQNLPISNPLPPPILKPRLPNHPLTPLPQPLLPPNPLLPPLIHFPPQHEEPPRPPHSLRTNSTK